MTFGLSQRKLNKICKMCFDGIGDKYHYLFLCKETSCEPINNITY